MSYTKVDILIEDIKKKNLYNELTVHFQPIFHVQTGKIFGYEALARHKTKKINTQKLFENAKRDGSIHELDMICRRNALKEASKQGLKNYLFINVCPETLLNPQHTIGLTDRFADEFNFPKEKIILEITEQTAIENYEIFIKSLFYYKDRGYKIAIDDFGAGCGGPKLLSILEPDIVKIDRHFISTITDNYISRSFVEFTISICHEKNIMVVAEGIETQRELNEVIKLGVDLIQGFYLGMPSKLIKNSYNECL